VEEVPPDENEVLDAGAQEEEDDIYGHGDDDNDEPRAANLHPQDPANFFKLSLFLKIVLAHSVTDSDIDQAEALIRSYCAELMHVCHFGPLASKGHTESCFSSMAKT
jgi:hypothetical protein